MPPGGRTFPRFPTRSSIHAVPNPFLLPLLLLFLLANPLSTASACTVTLSLPSTTSSRVITGNATVCSIPPSTPDGPTRTLSLTGSRLSSTTFVPPSPPSPSACFTSTVTTALNAVGRNPLQASFGPGCIGSAAVFREGVQLRAVSSAAASQQPSPQQQSVVNVPFNRTRRYRIILAERGNVVTGAAAAARVRLVDPVPGVVTIDASEGVVVVRPPAAGGGDGVDATIARVGADGRVVQADAEGGDAAARVRVAPQLRVRRVRVLFGRGERLRRPVRVVLGGAAESVERRAVVVVGGREFQGDEVNWTVDAVRGQGVGVYVFPGVEGSEEDLAGAQMRVTVVFGGGRTVVVEAGDTFQGLREPDQDLDVHLSVLQSAYAANRSLFVLPVVCGRSNVPVLLADVSGRPSGTAGVSFEFSWRLVGAAASTAGSAFGGGQWVEIDTGADGESVVAAIQVDGLFVSGDDVDASAVVEARVIATSPDSGETGQSIVRIARKLEPEAVGVTVLGPSPGIAAASDTATCGAEDAPPPPASLVEGTFSSAIHCPNPAQVRQETTWTIDGVQVASRVAGTLGDGGDVAVQLGFGSGIVLPSGSSGDVQVKVAFRDSLTNETLGIGESLGSPFSGGQSGRRPVALINDGAQTLRVPPGSRFELVAFDADDLQEVESKTYSWGCTLGDNGACETTLLPSLDSKSLAITAPGDVGSTAEFTLTVTSKGVSSRVASMTLRVVEPSTGAGESLFPPGGRLVVGDGRTLVPTNPCRSTILPHEMLLYIPQPEFLGKTNSETFGYGLFSEGGSNDLLKDDMLVKHDGYWTREKTGNGILGLKPNSLAPGNYTLVGSVGGDVKVADGPGSAWRFRVAPKASLSVSRLPIVKGTATETLFHAAASSNPPGFLFYYALRREKPDNPASTPISASDCLGSCSGARAVSFLAPSAGTFYVQVDMVGANSEVVASAVAEDSITVGPAAQPSNISAVLGVQAARVQNDETAFLEAVERLNKEVASGAIDEDDMDAELAVNASRGIKTLAETSILTSLRATKVVQVGTGLLEAPVKSELMENLDAANLAVVLRVQQTSTGEEMPVALSSFYQRAIAKLLRASRELDKGSPSSRTIALRQGEDTSKNDTSDAATLSKKRMEKAAMLSQLSGSSVRAVGGAAMRGRECGYSFSQAPSESSEDEDGQALLVSQSTCYPGQSSSVQACSSSSTSAVLAGQSNVLSTSSSEGASQLATGEKDVDDDNLLWSPIVAVDGFRQNAGGRRAPFDDECLNVTIPVQSDTDLRERLEPVFRKEMLVRCAAAVTLFKREATNGGVREVSPVPEASTFVRFSKSGELSTTVPSFPGLQVFISLNREALLDCLAADGRGPRAWVIVLVTLLTAAALLGVCILCFWCGRIKYRERSATRDLSKPTEGMEVDGFGTNQAASPASSRSSKATEGTWVSGELSKPPRVEQVIYFDDESSSESDVLTGAMQELAAPVPGVGPSDRVRPAGDVSAPAVPAAATRGPLVDDMGRVDEHEESDDPPLVGPSGSYGSSHGSGSDYSPRR